MLIKFNEVDVSDKLLNYSRTTCFSENYITGNVPTQQLDISLDNEDSIFTYEKLKDVIFTVKPTDLSEELYFKVYDMPETWDKVLELKLYDTCYELDKFYTTHLAYPTTIQEQLEEIEQIANVEIDISNIPSYVLEREIGWYDSTLKIREYIGWIACLFNANVIPLDEFGKIGFEIFKKDTSFYCDDLLDYKKGNDYLISKVSFNNGFVLEKGFETNNNYFLDPGNLYISKQEDIDRIYSDLKGLHLNSVTNVEMDYIDNLHLGHIIECFGEFRFVVKSIIEKYVGGDSPDYILDGELPTINKELVGQKIPNSTKIKRLQIITDEINSSLTITAKQVEDNKEDISNLEISLEGIKTEVSKTINSIYKFESGSGNIYLNCYQMLTKNFEETGIKYINDMPLDINMDFMRNKDICISCDVLVQKGIIGNLGNFLGAEFEVGYADGTKKKYYARWYLGQYNLQYLLQTSTVDHEERIWMHYKIEDKEITSVSNLKMIIAMDCELAIVANPKVEFGTYPTGFEFDMSYIRDNITTIQKDYTEIKQDVSTLTLKSVSMEEEITTIKGDVSSVTTRLQSAEISLQPTNILLAVNESIGAGGELYTTKFMLDKSGAHISGGGIDISNNAGVKVLYADMQGNLVINNLTAVNGNFSGVVNANDGVIGGWNVNENGLDNGTVKIDKSGVTNIYTWGDLAVIQMIIMGSMTGNADLIKHYDFNGDGKVTSLDYMILLNKLKAL